MPERHNSRRSLIAEPVARFFDQQTAAAYLGLGDRSFDNGWRNGTMPGPHRLGRRLVWDRVLLDQWADIISGIQIPAGTEVDDFADF